VTRADNTRYLAQATTARHDAALERAQAAIERLDRTGGAVNFGAVARAASVSRAWLYDQPELRGLIEQLRETPTLPPRVPTSQRASAESQRQRVASINAEIARLRRENADLQDQLARRLGHDRAGR
jgi:hypothetical protein